MLMFKKKVDFWLETGNKLCYSELIVVYLVVQSIGEKKRKVTFFDFIIHFIIFN